MSSTIINPREEPGCALMILALGVAIGLVGWLCFGSSCSATCNKDQQVVRASFFNVYCYCEKTNE